MRCRPNGGAIRPIHWLLAAALKYRPPGEAATPRQPTVAELKAAFAERSALKLKDTAMTDANVSVSFSASVADFVAGVGEAKEALQSFSAPFGEINGQLASLANASSAGLQRGAP